MGGGMGPGGGMGGGMGPGGGMGGGMGPGGGRGGSNTDSGDEDEEIVYKKLAISHEMKDPSTRKRQNLAREEKVDGETIYYVSEKYGDDGEFTEVQVPKGEEYSFLRYARPTQWSAPVTVNVTRQHESFFAGEFESPRMVDFRNGTIPDGDMSVDMVVESIFENAAKLPLKSKFSAGSMLNAKKLAHILHPVTWNVHELVDAKVETDAALVDLIGGEELGLPRGEPIRYSDIGEALVFDAEGNFRIRRDTDDRGAYRRALLLKDEKAAYNIDRAKKRRQRDNNNNNNPFGGMGGGGAGPGGGMGGGAGPGGGRGGGRGRSN
jgi:hypothetical protein